MSKRRSKWRDLVDNEVVRLLRIYRRRGIKPTLRSIHYNLTSTPELNLPNTPATYTQLSRFIVEARKDGRIPWDAIADNTRYTIGDYHFTSPEDHVDLGTRYLANAPKHYPNSIYRWHKQPHYVEVWIEKDAMSSVFRSYLEPLHVSIVINKGYSSWTALYKNCQRLLDIRHKDPSTQIHILYFGDYDPSGNDMENQMHEAFNYFGLEGPDSLFGDIDFRRVAVTMEQIDQLDLPHVPEDQKTRDKLENDSRTKKSMEDNFGELYAVELDALFALYPDEFERLIIDIVNGYFDEEIYYEIISNPAYQEDAIRRLVHDKIMERGL
jgi:hypothetical protein